MRAESDTIPGQNNAYYKSIVQGTTCSFCTLEEFILLRAMEENLRITQKRLSELTEISRRTIKRRTVAMQEKGHLTRESSRRSGSWRVLIEISRQT